MGVELVLCVSVAVSDSSNGVLRVNVYALPSIPLGTPTCITDEFVENTATSIGIELKVIVNVNSLDGHVSGNPYPFKIMAPPLMDPSMAVAFREAFNLRSNELVYPMGSSLTLTAYVPACRLGMVKLTVVVVIILGTTTVRTAVNLF